MTQPTSQSTQQVRAADSRRGEVQQFLDRFAKALVTGDARALATMWEVPALVASDMGMQGVSSREEVEQFFAGAKDQYNARGIVDTRGDIRRLDWITERIALVEVRWPYIDERNREVGEESSTYALRRADDGALMICGVVMQGEMTR
jgi:hypothetical protein